MNKSEPTRRCSICKGALLSLIADLSAIVATLKSSADSQRPQSVNAAMATPVAMGLTSDATFHPGISRFHTQPRISDAS
jgi:hypothetical protein